MNALTSPAPRSLCPPRSCTLGTTSRLVVVPDRLPCLSLSFPAHPRCVCARSTSDLGLRLPKQTTHSIPASARRLASPPRALVAQRAAFASHLRRATKRPDTGKGGWDAVIAGRCEVSECQKGPSGTFWRARDAEAHAHHLTGTRVRMRMMSTDGLPCVLRGPLSLAFWLSGVDA